jgi:hypothetical protein
MNELNIKLMNKINKYTNIRIIKYIDKLNKYINK